MRIPRNPVTLMFVCAILLAPQIVRGAEFKNWCLMTENGPWGRATAAVFRGSIYAVGSVYTDAYSHGRLMRSANGIHWTNIPVEWASGWGDCKLVAFDNVLWAIINNKSGNLQISQSTDGQAWTALSSIEPPARNGFAVAVFQNKIWLVGGDNGLTLLNDVWNSDNGKSWTLVAQGNQTGLPAIRNAALIPFRDQLWVLGGTTGTYYGGELGDITESGAAYSSTDSANWAERGNLGEGRGGACAAVWNDKLRVYGGEYALYRDADTYDKYGYTTDSFTCSDDGKNWGPDTNAPVGDIQDAAAVVFNGRVFLIGGQYWGEDDDPSARSSVWATPNPRYIAIAGDACHTRSRRSGQTVSIDVLNSGTASWSAASQFGLRAFSDPQGVWAGTTSTLFLAPGTIVKPGESYRFTIPVNLANLWLTAILQVKMYQTDVGFFGDTATITLNYRLDHQIAWSRMETENRVDTLWPDLITASDKYLWCHNWRSSDGACWIKAVDAVHKPWSDWDEGVDRDFPVPSYISFKDRLYLVDSEDIWKSSDGMSWSRSGPKWGQYHSEDFDDDYGPEVSSCCVFNDRLYALISYDIDDLESETDYEYLNVIWSTSDGSNWSKVGKFTELAFCGKLINFKGKLWMFGGQNKAIDSEDGEYSVTTVNASDIYSSPDGKSWKLEGQLPRPALLQNIVVYRDQLWAADETGAMFSADGIHWEPANAIPDGSCMQVFKDKIWVLEAEKVWCGTTDQHSVAISPMALDFGRREVMTGPGSAKTVNVRNAGLSGLSFVGSGAEIVSSRPGEFSFAPAPNLSPVNVSRAMNIVFSPKRIGPTSATLEITTNDPAHPTTSVRLMGEGISTRPLKSGDILAYLLGITNDGQDLDQNGDGKTDIADFVFIQNSPVTVTSPTLTSIVPLSSPFSIRWDARTQIGRVKIELARNHRPVSTLDSDTANEGSYSATMPAGLVPDSNYSVIVTDAAHPSIQGESPFFTVASAGNALTMRYPNGGEVFSRGNKIPLHWTGGSGVKNIRLELYKNDGYYKTIVTSRAASEGDVYAWTIPGDWSTGGNFRAVVIDADHTATRSAGARVFSIK